MSASDVTGMALMATGGVLSSICIISSTILTAIDLPYYYLCGTGQLIMHVVLVLALGARGDFAALPRSCWKWVFLRGLFGCGALMLALLSVACGAPLGDASALSSISVVVSALLGRAFLGESLRAPHMLALAMSVAGAVLISQPESLLALLGHGPLEGGVPWLGYLLALSSGFSSGGQFIASRKSQGIDPMILTASVVLMEGGSHWVVALTGAVEELPLRAVAEAPFEAAGLVVVYALLVLVSSICLSLGAQHCPAAVSSTIYTSTSMSLSYLAQMVFHHHVPAPLSVLGAGLMLAAVALMALARWLYARPALAAGAAAPAGAPAASPASAARPPSSADDDAESLVSFVASEFSGVSKEELRQRRSAALAVEPATLGHAGA